MIASVIALAALLAQPAIGVPSWSDRGIFAFDGLLIDFQRTVERGSTPFGAPLVNCSTEALFCAQGHHIRVVFPRSCGAWPVGTSWAHMGVRTEVLAQYEEPLHPHRIGSGQRLLLGHTDQPYIVFEYDLDAGIVSVWYDPTERTDFVSMAIAETLFEAPLEWPQRHMGLLSVDPFGRCQR